MRCLTLSVIRLNPRGVKKRKKKRKKSVESLLRDSHFLLVPMDTAVKYGPCLLALQKKRIKFFETKCMRKLLRISHLEHKTSDWVRSKISFLVGPQEPLLATVKRRKLARSGQVTRHDSLSKTLPQGTLEDGRRRGQKRKCWMDGIKEWTSLPILELLTRASCRIK